MPIVTKIINKFDEKLKGRFLNTYKCSNHDNNKFISLLQKGWLGKMYELDLARFLSAPGLPWQADSKKQK